VFGIERGGRAVTFFERIATDPFYFPVPHIVWDGRHVYFLARMTPMPSYDEQEVYLWIGDCPEIAGGGVLAGVAHAEGAAGTRWCTDVSLTSRAALTDEIVLSFRPFGAPEEEIVRHLVLEGGKTVTIEDVVGTLFETEGTGIIEIRPRSAGVAVSARTYDENTHMGQGLPLLSDADGFSTGEAAVITGAVDDASARSNLGLVNLREIPMTLRIAVFDEEGERIALRTHQLEALESIQINRILLSSDGQEHSDGYLEISTDTPDARFAAYLSRVDNASSDPVFITPSFTVPPLP